MAIDPKSRDELLKKWEPILEGDLPPIKDAYRRRTTTILLDRPVYDASTGEIKLAAKTELETFGGPRGEPRGTEVETLYANGRQTTNQAEALIDKAQDRLEAYDTIGVSPMAGPTGLLSAAQKEALGMESGYAEAAPVVWYDDPPTGGEGCCCSPKRQSPKIIYDGPGVAPLTGPSPGVFAMRPRAPVKDYRWAIVAIAAFYIMGVILTFA
jgi:hypothetical protein